MATQLLLTNYKNEVERALMAVLRLAFLHRPVVASLAALAALNVEPVADGDLRWVTDQARVYAYSRFSGAVADALNVVAPTTIPAKFPRARWLRQESAATYGPNWRAPLHTVAAGKLRAVELYSGDGSSEEQWQRVEAASPAMLLEWRSDEPEGLSAGYQGSFYRIRMTYAVTVFSDNNRAAPHSSWGSPATLGETDDPGPAAIIGAMRKVCAGLKGGDLGLEGVDRVEIGASRLVDEQLAERWLVWEADLHLLLFVPNPDEDLDAMRVTVEPHLSDNPKPGHEPFDPLNYVAQGYTITPVAGLTATPAAGVAVIAGSAVSSTPLARTFTAERDTYRDLKADGTFAYLEALPGRAAPAVTAGALRVGRTRTDAADVVEDEILCSWSEQFRAPYQVLP